MPGSAQRQVRQFFQLMAKQLSAQTEMAIAEHSGLKGGHREEVCRTYLRKILPERYEIGRGMVYGSVHRSREADIVLWDALNYPKLQLSDHTFFFAESIRAVLEVKSRWSADEFLDVRDKAKAVRDVVSGAGPNLADQIGMLRLEIASLRQGIEHEGMLLTKHHIGTGAIFLKGGERFSLESLTEEDLESADDEWPDVLLLLQPGKVVIKRYQAHGGFSGSARLEVYDLEEDALLFFTNALLLMLSDRVVHSESQFYFTPYAFDVLETAPSQVVGFPITRPVPQRQALWHGT